MSQPSPHPASPLSVSWTVSSDDPAAFDAYRDSISGSYDVTREPAPPGAVFMNHTSAFKFGASVLGRGRSVGQSMVKTADHVRKAQLDHVSIVINLVDWVIDAGGRDGVAPAGAVQFRDLGKPSRSRTGRVDMINLIAPRSSAPSLLLGRKLHELQLPGDSPGGQLIASHLETLARVAHALTEAEGIAAVEATFLIAERFLGGRSTLSPLQIEAVQRTIRKRAIKVLDTLPPCQTPDFSDVSFAIGVSRSSLYRAFAPHGGVQTYIVRRRLNRAHATLRARVGATPTVVMVAEQNGYSSTIQFVRAFRNQFGISPFDLPNLRSPSSDRGQQDDGGTLHDVVFDWLRLGDETP